MLESIYEVLLELSPWFLLGMLVSGLLHVLLPRDFIKHQLKGSAGVVKAVLLGVPLPLCSCGVIPAGLGLKRDGASNGASMGFLISTPQTGVDSILVSASFLGWPFALFKVAAAAITGVIGGLLGERIPDTDGAARDLGAASSEESRRGLRAMIEHAHDLLASIWRWLVFGVVVSAAIDTFLPVGTLGIFADLGSFGAGIAVLLVSLPLYVCATASVPIAAAMVANGMPIGASLVFLMAGPATNVATIGAIYRGFGGRQLAAYLGVLIVGSIGFGALFDSAINPATVTHHIQHQDHQTWWAVASTLLLVGLITRLAVLDLVHFVRERSAGSARDKVEVSVEGMTCGKCARKVEGALLGLEGVTSAVVTRNPDRAIVRGDVDRSRIREAIIGAGYRVHPA
ncbi:MAG: hypothetical protein GY733_06515 [bacterium]|nr:hypothetical protein [bacterium]